MNHGEIVSFLWSIAELIKHHFKRGHYQDVILPLTVLRRLDCVLAETKQKVLAAQAKYKGKLENLDPQLRAASGYAFYNTSRYDFEKLVADAPHLAANLRNYIAGFSQNMREVVERFDFDNTISKLDESGQLFKVVQEFKSIDLHPDRVDNPTMGTIFEELIRKFNEALNENPGEHFTPRDVVHLMVDVMLAGDEQRLRRKGAVVSIYDSCCGTGGMLMLSKEHIRVGVRRNGDILRPSVNAKADVHLFGQEVNPQTWAIAKSDLYIKEPTGRDAENIAFGSTLSNDKLAGQSFDYLITNPPYGHDWHNDEDAVRKDYARGAGSRFAASLPRISDGQLLFLLHLLSHRKELKEGGSRIAIIMNGSPLFTGDAGSGESEIRRYILENDLLEALIALPEQLFYNTGIATYIWVLTNRKSPKRKGKVQLIDTTSEDPDRRRGLFWAPMPKSLGDKRREIPLDKTQDILKILGDFKDGDTRFLLKDGKQEEVVVSKIFPTEYFGYRRITVERPLKLNFAASRERIERLNEQRAFQNLAQSKKKGAAGAKDEATGRALQEAILRMLSKLPKKLYADREEFVGVLGAAAKKADILLAAPLLRAILSALSERDEKAEICRDKDGSPEPDTELRDSENVPLGEGIDEFFDREVKPHVADAWIDRSKRDEKDNQVGVVGYEINFNRYFYRYTPPRPLEEIETDIRAIEEDILRMLAEVTGRTGSNVGT